MCLTRFSFRRNLQVTRGLREPPARLAPLSAGGVCVSAAFRGYASKQAASKTGNQTDAEGIAVPGKDDTWTGACVALIVGVAALDAVMGGGLESVMAAGSVIASTQLSPHRTAFVGALALAAGIGIAGFNGRLGELAVLLRLIAALGISGVCVAAARSREQRERRLLRLARVAEVAQQAILKPMPVRAGHVAFATRYLSASEDALVGGDLYELVATADAVRLIVGDVRGKGLDAVRLAALVLAAFRDVAGTEATLAAVAKAVDNAIFAYLDEEGFVTAIFAEFFPGGRVSIVNCGHHPPLRIAASHVEPLESPDASLPLGLEPQFLTDTYTLGPDERLLVYTDGLVEARDPDGLFFDLSGLPAQFLSSSSLDATLEALVKRLQVHIGGRLNDDLALVLAQPLVTVDEPTGGHGHRDAASGRDLMA